MPSANDVLVTANCRLIISSSYDTTVRVSDVETLQIIDLFKGLTPTRWHMEISRSRKLVVTRFWWKKKIRIWDLVKCDGSHEIIETNDMVRQVLISEDEKKVIVSAFKKEDGQFFQVWNVENKQMLRRITRPSISGLSKEQIFRLSEEPEHENM